LKIEQLLYLQIFNFYRKFESLLKNFASGILVIISNFGQPQGATSRPTPASFERLPGVPSTASSGFSMFAAYHASS
jgi:hypothetical protein